MPFRSVGVQTVESCLNIWYVPGEEDPGVLEPADPAGGLPLALERQATGREEPSAALAALGAGRRADIRHYVVWSIPGDPAASGIWTGPHPRVRAAISQRAERGCGDLVVRPGGTTRRLAKGILLGIASSERDVCCQLPLALHAAFGTARSLAGASLRLPLALPGAPWRQATGREELPSAAVGAVRPPRGCPRLPLALATHSH